jgi:DNA-binding MarR family transcriptional regulator
LAEGPACLGQGCIRRGTPFGREGAGAGTPWGIGLNHCLDNDLPSLSLPHDQPTRPVLPASGPAQAVLWSGPMHAIAFGAKRVFHSFLRVTRRPLLSWPGLTGARFDLLSAFLEGEYRRPDCIELRQSELRRRLGVCASVVSRMLRALVERGWIARCRDADDRRAWRLWLTPAGEQVIRAARRLLLRAVERIVNDALVLPWWRRGRHHLFCELMNYNHYLDAIRYRFADCATLEYPWWPTPFDH